MQSIEKQPFLMLIRAHVYQGPIQACSLGSRFNSTKPHVVRHHALQQGLCCEYAELSGDRESMPYHGGLVL